MIKLLVFDVDGTLSDGKVFFSQSGEEIKGFDIKDGLARKRGRYIAYFYGCKR